MSTAFIAPTTDWAGNVPEDALAFPREWSMAELQAHLGVPAERICMYPPPGLAVEEDVLRAHDQWGKLCELIDGVLVEKAVGQYESHVATWVIYFITNYLVANSIGKVYAPDGPIRVLPRQVRMPDIAFVRADRYPSGKSPKAGILPFPPDLAVEVLSPSNTRKEMRRKLAGYFGGGTRLVWYIDPDSESATVYTSESDATAVPAGGTLDGGDVLPGFQLSLVELFRLVGPREA